MVTLRRFAPKEVIIQEGDGIGVVDRGSRLGAMVDNIRIGGVNTPGPIFFKGGEGESILGVDSSPYRFKIRFS